MDIASVIRQRLDERGLEQRDLAMAAEVTESYISQLLAGKKLPLASDRTDLYDKIAGILKLPRQELGRLADTQRREERKRQVLDPPRPLFGLIPTSVQSAAKDEGVLIRPLLPCLWAS